MVQIQDTLWCDACGVEITWGPVIVAQHQYCCLDCQEGRVCRCGERMELEEDRRVVSLTQW